jgi:multidrug resistance protein MdtO
MLCYILYSLLDWPGIHTCLITCYIVSLGTAAETVEKLGLRILGCILGAAAGIAAIIILVPALTSVGALIIMVFLAAFVSAWVAGGDPRIAYAGFQMAFAFFLCVIQGAGPSFDMVNARDRVIGILLGDVVVYLIFTNVWPVSVVERIDPAITAVLGKLGGLLAANRISAALTASATQTALAGLERDLDLAAYEPASIRPVSEWLEQRWQAAADLRALEPMFLLCAAQDPKLAQDIAARLRRFGGTAPAASPGGNLTSPLVALRGPIEALLQSLEHWQSAPDKDEAVANAAVSRAGLVGRPRAKRDSNTKGHSQ